MEFKKTTTLKTKPCQQITPIKWDCSTSNSVRQRDVSSHVPGLLQNTCFTFGFKWLFHGHAGFFSFHLFTLITHYKMTNWELTFIILSVFWMTNHGIQNFSCETLKTTALNFSYQNGFFLHHVGCWRIGINVCLLQLQFMSGLSEHRINMLSVTLSGMYKTSVL